MVSWRWRDDPAAVNSSAKTPVHASRSTSFEPDVASAFGSSIRMLREQQGIAQDAFALSAGVDRSYYGKLERGERQPSLGLLLRISGALGMTGAEVVGHAEKALLKLRKKPRAARDAG